MTTAITFQLFAKAPIAGAVKTRLIPALSATDAALLHTRLVERTAAAITQARRSLPHSTGEMWCAPDCVDPVLRGIAGRHRMTLLPQEGADLGARMHNALTSAMPGRAILVGSDCPLLDAAILLRAATALAHDEIVFVPAEDGGYALVGCRNRVPPCFDDIAWSGPRVMRDTRRRLRESGLDWVELAAIWDVDTPTDLLRLSRDTSCAPLLDGLALTAQTQQGRDQQPI